MENTIFMVFAMVELIMDVYNLRTSYSGEDFTPLFNAIFQFFTPFLVAMIVVFFILIVVRVIIIIGFIRNKNIKEAYNR